MNHASARWFLCLAFAAIVAAPSALCAQDSLRVLSDTTRVQVIRLSDGSVVVGRVVAVRGDSAVIRTQSGQLTMARSAVRRVRERAMSSMRGGEYWPEDPNATRLFFAPTARMLEQGAGNFCDIWLFLLCLTGGLSDRVTIGGGMSAVPGIAIADNVFYVTPKVGLIAQEKFHVAVGAFAGWSGALRDDATSFGIFYGVSTFGSEDDNVSAGVGFAYYNDEIANTPLLLGGLKLRLSRGTAFISENYLLPGSEGGILSFGLRFFNERISGDVAFVRVALDGDDVMVPFVGLAVAFR
ncbi:MAG: hypothetical protein ACT4P6_14815 [Gemmatimonadaceae bacterium]